MWISVILPVSGLDTLGKLCYNYNDEFIFQLGDELMFCPKCGIKLEGDPKFCNECGAKLEQAVSEADNRIQCPSCGNFLKSYELFCPACGRELRDIEAINSVKRLEQMLIQIENERQPDAPNHSVWEGDKPTAQINIADQRKASCIQAFPIPNSKEDIIEFMVLAASNIHPWTIVLNNNTNGKDHGILLVAQAWYAKFEQAYQKARLSLSNDSQFSIIEDIYTKKTKEIRSKRLIRVWIVIGCIIALILLIVIPIILL